MVLITSTREPNSSFCCSSVSVSPILRTSSTTPSPAPPAPWSRTTARTSSSKCSYYTRVVVLTKSAIVTVVQFLSTGFPRKKNIFLPLLLSASTVGFHQPSQCLKNISKWSLKDSRNCFENPHQEEPLNITQHFSTLFVLLGLLLLPLALSPHSACALFLLCKKKKTLKRGSVDPKPPKTDIVYISDSQQLIVWDKCVCFIIGIIISSPSFTLANLGNFFIWIFLCLSKKTEEKKYLIIISSITFLRGMWIFLLLSLKYFSLEQGKSWLATFASLKLARPFLMKPPKSILYLCRIVAHNGLKTKKNKKTQIEILILPLNCSR